MSRRTRQNPVITDRDFSSVGRAVREGDAAAGRAALEAATDQSAADFAATELATTGSDLRTAADALYRYGNRKVITVADVIAPGYKAFHRGVGANNVWVAPEHTLEGYRVAMAMGAQVIDLDVSVTADGVVVCHHDTSLLRTTGVDANVADYPFAMLPPVDQRSVVGAGWGTQRIPTLEEVVAEFGGRVVLNCEPKDDSSVPALLDLITGYGLERSVIINAGNDSVVAAASAAGVYAHRWGIASTGNVDTAVAAGAAILEIPYASIGSTLVNYALAKKGTGNVEHVICGPIQRRYERDAALALNVDGFISDSPGYLDATPQATSLAKHIASQKVGVGWWQSFTSSVVGIIDSTGVQLSKTTKPNRGLRLGDFNGSKGTIYSVEFAWKASGASGDKTVRPTFRFCVVDDRGDGLDATVANGYECDMRVNGQMRANKGGVGSFSSLGTLQTPEQADGAEAKLKVYVNASTIAIVRTDIAAAVLSSSVSAGTVTSLPVNALSAAISSGTVLRLPNGQYATVSSTASISATSISINSLAVSSTLASGASLRYTLGPYSDTAYRGNNLWVVGSTAGSINGCDMTLTNLTYTANDA